MTPQADIPVILTSRNRPIKTMPDHSVMIVTNLNTGTTSNIRVHTSTYECIRINTSNWTYGYIGVTYGYIRETYDHIWLIRMELAHLSLNIESPQPAAQFLLGKRNHCVSRDISITGWRDLLFISISHAPPLWTWKGHGNEVGMKQMTIINRVGYGNELRFALRFSFSPCFRIYFCASH